MHTASAAPDRRDRINFRRPVINSNDSRGRPRARTNSSKSERVATDSIGCPSSRRRVLSPRARPLGSSMLRSTQRHRYVNEQRVDRTARLHYRPSAGGRWPVVRAPSEEPLHLTRLSCHRGADPAYRSKIIGPLARWRRAWRYDGGSLARRSRHRPRIHTGPPPRWRAQRGRPRRVVLRRQPLSGPPWRTSRLGRCRQRSAPLTSRSHE